MKSHQQRAQPKEPARGPLTANQLVSYNLMRARKARGLTQAELADRMESMTRRPWSNASVSAAERAWKGGRPRKFDADEIIGFSLALSFPVGYFLLAPDDSPIDLAISMTQPDLDRAPNESKVPFAQILPGIAGIGTGPGYGERMKVLFAKYLDVKYQGPGEVVEFEVDRSILRLEDESSQLTDEERDAIMEEYQQAIDDTAVVSYNKALLKVMARVGLREVVEEARREFGKRMPGVTADAVRKIVQLEEREQGRS